MAYVFCDTCGIGFHSNVHSCPQCGRVASRTYQSLGPAHRRTWWRHSPPALPRDEDVETEVRETIYGWRSGTVELHDSDSAAAHGPDA